MTTYPGSATKEYIKMEVGVIAMTDNEQEVLGLFDQPFSNPPRTLRVVHVRGVWVPPDIQRDLKSEIDLTAWWLKKHDRWTDDITLTAVVLDDETGERSITGYPIMDEPDLPAEQQDISYYLGSDSAIYLYVAAESGFVTLDTSDVRMQDEIRYLIKQLRCTRGE